MLPLLIRLSCAKDTGSHRLFPRCLHPLPKSMVWQSPSPRRPYAEAGESSAIAAGSSEVTLDCAVGDEQRLCDLPVAEVLAGELGDATFAGCQRVEAGEDHPARTRASRPELSVGPFGEPTRASAVGAVKRFAEELSRFAGRLGRRSRAPRSARARALSNPESARPKPSTASRSRRLSAITAQDDAGGPLRHAQCARGAECPGKLELLFLDAPSLLGIPEREMGQRGLRSPGEETRADDVSSG